MKISVIATEYNMTIVSENSQLHENAMEQYVEFIEKFRILNKLGNLILLKN